MKGRLISLFVGILLLVGCAKVPPQTSPEGTLAVRGIQVIEGLRATIPALKLLVCRRDVPTPVCISTVDADKIAAKIGDAANYGRQLSEALLLVERATTPGEKVSNAAKARQTLASIQLLLSEAAILPENQAVRAQLVQLFSNLTALIIAVNPTP